MIKRPFPFLLCLANSLLIGTFIYSPKIADWLLSGYNLLLVYLSFELSLKLCQQALQQLPQKNMFFVPNAVYRNLKMLFLLCYIASQIFLEPSVSGFLAIAVGLLFIADLREFHHRELMHKPVMAFYVAQACGGLVYLWLGYTQLTNASAHLALCALFVLFSLPITMLYWRYCVVSNEVTAPS